MVTKSSSSAANGGMASYNRKKNKEDMKHQVITFILMIFMTAVAFLSVAYDTFSPSFAVPFILLLAVVQVIFQLYYFMHMKHEGHETPALFIFSGVFIAITTIAALMLIVWW